MMCGKLSALALFVCAIGAINWGLVAINPKAELIQYLSVGGLITTVYAIVGLCGIWALIKAFQD